MVRRGGAPTVLQEGIESIGAPEEKHLLRRMPVSEDIFYESVRGWISARLKQEDQFLAPSLLLAEIGDAISRRTTPTLGLKAIEQVQRLPGLQLVEMEQSLLQEAARLAAELGLRGADSSYVAVAARLGTPLITLDADQRERAAKRIKVLDIAG